MAFSSWRAAWMLLVLVTGGCFVNGEPPATDDGGLAEAADDAADGDGGDTRNFDWLYTNVLSTGCGVGSCHDSTFNLDLSGSADLTYNQLLHGHPVMICLGNGPASKQAFVVPGDPAHSNLYLKVTGTTCQGTQMPLHAPPLPQDMLDAIQAWIASGAAR
jgi:hypothetical protein